MKLTQEPKGAHWQKRYQNVSLSLASKRCCIELFLSDISIIMLIWDSSTKTLFCHVKITCILYHFLPQLERCQCPRVHKLGNYMISRSAQAGKCLVHHVSANTDRNVIREFIWAAATLLCAHIRTGFFDAYCTYVNSHKNIAYTHARTIHVSNGLYTGIDPCTKNEEQPKLVMDTKFL